MRSGRIGGMVVVSALLSASWACGQGTSEPSSSRRVLPPAPPKGETWETRSLRTQTGKYRVELALDPPSPPMGELFAVNAVVTDGRSGEPVEAARVKLDALMPHHGHGMMTQPINLEATCEGREDSDDGPCLHVGGRYRTEGFKFHMPGSWTVTVEVNGPRGRDTTSVIYEQRVTR